MRADIATLAFSLPHRITSLESLGSRLEWNQFWAGGNSKSYLNERERARGGGVVVTWKRFEALDREVGRIGPVASGVCQIEQRARDATGVAEAAMFDAATEDSFWLWHRVRSRLISIPIVKDECVAFIEQHNARSVWSEPLAMRTYVHQIQRFVEFRLVGLAPGTNSVGPLSRVSGTSGTNTFNACGGK